MSNFTFQKANVGNIMSAIRKGVLHNDKFATNFSMAFFQNPNAYATRSIFPIIPVDLPVGQYAIFDKADLARINVARKPQFGKVQPFQVSNTFDTFSVDVYQAIIGLDQITQTVVNRSGVPGSSNVKESRTRILAEQFGMFQDMLFAEKFFVPGAWENEYEGTDSNASGKKFLRFNDANFAPISFFNEIKKEMKRETRRAPNKLLLGIDAYNGLCNNPDLRERISGSSSKASPAIVEHADLCRMLGFEQISVFDASYNAAPLGKEADMQFICDPKAALVCYAPSSPAIDEPSAGYTFTWDMLGNGQYAPMFVNQGAPGTHSEELEGLLATSHKKTCDELGVFLKDCVA